MRLFGDPDNALDTGDVPQGPETVNRFRVRPANIKTIVAFASARGGTGKSSLTVNLAVALALKGRKVAILDADLASPCIATMLGMRRIQAFQASGVIEPAAGPLGLRVIGSDLLGSGTSSPVSLFENEDVAPVAPEPVAMTDSERLRQLLSETRFGPL